MSVQEYLLREPARKLAKARGISEREAMQELKDKSDQLQRMTAIGVGVSGGGTAPRGLPERSLGTSPRGMRGTINGVKGTGAPRSPVAEALDLPPKIEKPSALPSKPAVRGIEKPAYDHAPETSPESFPKYQRKPDAKPLSENPPDKEVLDYRQRAHDAMKARKEALQKSRDDEIYTYGMITGNKPEMTMAELGNKNMQKNFMSAKERAAWKRDQMKAWDERSRALNPETFDKEQARYKAERKQINADTKYNRELTRGLPPVRKGTKFGDFETISDPNVPEPVKIRDVKKYNDRGEKVKQGIRKRKQE